MRALWAGISFEVALWCLVCSPRLFHCSSKQLVTQTHEVPQVNVLMLVFVCACMRAHVCLCAPNSALSASNISCHHLSNKRIKLPTWHSISEKQVV